MEKSEALNPTASKRFDYKAAVTEGIKQIDQLLQRIDVNQAETARMRAETDEILQQLQEKLKAA
jgi:hypothetical protein